MDLSQRLLSGFSAAPPVLEKKEEGESGKPDALAEGQVSRTGVETEQEMSLGKEEFMDGSLLIVISMISLILSKVGLVVFVSEWMLPVTMGILLAGHSTSYLLKNLGKTGWKAQFSLNALYFAILFITAVGSSFAMSLFGEENGLGKNTMAGICSKMKLQKPESDTKFSGWMCYPEDKAFAEAQCSVGVCCIIFLQIGTTICSQASNQPWSFTRVLPSDIRRSILAENSLVPKNLKDIVAGVTIGGFNDFRGFLLFLSLVNFSLTLLFCGETFLCFLSQCVLVQSESEPNVVIVILSSLFNMVFYYFSVVIFLRHSRFLASNRYSSILLLDGSESRRLRGAGYLDVVLRGQSSLIEGRVPMDQTSVKSENKPRDQKVDALVSESNEANSNLGPRDVAERAIASGLVGFICYTIVGIAYNNSPAALRGQENISRATRGKKNQSLKTGIELVKKMDIARESQNVLPASNGTALIRISLAESTAQAFSLNLVAVVEQVAMESWARAGSSIGSGLSRPELYILSRQSPANWFSLRSYCEKRNYLQKSQVEMLLCPEAAWGGVVSDFIAELLKSGDLEKVMEPLTEVVESLNLRAVHPPIMTGFKIVVSTLLQLIRDSATPVGPQTFSCTDETLQDATLIAALTEILDYSVGESSEEILTIATESSVKDIEKAMLENPDKDRFILQEHRDECMNKVLEAAGKSLVFQYQVTCLKITSVEGGYALELVNIPADVTYPNQVESVLLDYQILVIDESVDSLWQIALEDGRTSDLGRIGEVFDNNADGVSGSLLIYIQHGEPKVKKVDDPISPLFRFYFPA